MREDFTMIIKQREAGNAHNLRAATWESLTCNFDKYLNYESSCWLILCWLANLLIGLSSYMLLLFITSMLKRHCLLDFATAQRCFNDVAINRARKKPTTESLGTNKTWMRLSVQAKWHHLLSVHINESMLIWLFVCFVLLICLFYIKISSVGLNLICLLDLSFRIAFIQTCCVHWRKEGLQQLQQKLTEI